MSTGTAGSSVRNYSRCFIAIVALVVNSFSADHETKVAAEGLDYF